jgi:hypothetical protein
LPELEAELQTLRQATDTATGFVCARGKRLEEHLLDILDHVRDAVEYGVHRGAAVAQATAQVRSGHELRFLIGFPEGEGATDHERLVEDFDKATSAVTAEVPAEEVILEAL